MDMKMKLQATEEASWEICSALCSALFSPAHHRHPSAVRFPQSTATATATTIHLIATALSITSSTTPCSTAILDHVEKMETAIAMSCQSPSAAGRS